MPNHGTATPIYGVMWFAGLNYSLKPAALLFEQVVVAICSISKDEFHNDALGERVAAELFVGRASYLRENQQLDKELLFSDLQSMSDDPLFVDRQTRLLAQQLKETEVPEGEGTVVSMLHHQLPQTTPAASQPASIIRAILKHMPIPDIDTPWEAILDWRSDVDARRMYARLRAWMHRAARQGLSSAEALDEIASLLADYESYTSLQHKKLARGRLEIILTTAAELLEGAVTLRLSDAIRKAFELQREEVTLGEAELGAPGREVAFIAAARKRFGR